MALRTVVVKASILGLGAGALAGAGSLTFAGTAVAADCNSTAVKGLRLSRALGAAANSAIQPPTRALAFTGAAEAVAALLLGLALLLVGALLVAIGRRSRGAMWLLMLVSGIAVVTLIGQHAATAGPAVASATCTTTAGAGTGGTTAPGGTAPVGTTPVDPVAPSPVAPGPVAPTPVGPGPVIPSPTPPPALPDASLPIELVAVAATAGGVLLALRRRQTGS